MQVYINELNEKISGSKQLHKKITVKLSTNHYVQYNACRSQRMSIDQASKTTHFDHYVQLSLKIKTFRVTLLIIPTKAYA